MATVKADRILTADKFSEAALAELTPQEAFVSGILAGYKLLDPKTKSIGLLLEHIITQDYGISILRLHNRHDAGRYKSETIHRRAKERNT